MTFTKYKYKHIYKIFVNIITIDNWFKKKLESYHNHAHKKKTAKQTENQQLISDNSEN